MRRFRKLIVPALLFVACAILLGVLGNAGWDWLKDHLFVKKWGLPIVFTLAVIYVLWDAQRVGETTEERGDHPLRMRQRLMDRVLEFAQSQFDGGLYAKARKEFDLAERPLHITTEDRMMDVNVEPYYRSLRGPLVILGEPGTGKTTLLHELATLLCTATESDPIPVPFSLSNWALKGEPLAEWMVGELRRNYGVGSALARRGE